MLFWKIFGALLAVVIAIMLIKGSKVEKNLKAKELQTTDKDKK